MKTVIVMFLGENRKFDVLPETDGCDGCIALRNGPLCDQLNNFNCSDHRTIFVEASNEQSFTLDQIKAAWQDEYGGGCPGENFIKALTRVADPEYNEYKRLQSKFEV